MKYQDLVESVRDTAALTDAEQARASVAAVLATVARCLPSADRHLLAEHLPGSLVPAAAIPGPPEVRDGTRLVAEIGRRLHTSPERARYRAQAVLAALRDGEPRLVDLLCARLNSDVLDTLMPPADPPWMVTSVLPGMPVPLSDEEVRRALCRLTGWTGDRSAISRTVALPADRHTPLVNRVQREARELNDHAHVEREDATVTFTLTTGRPGKVTDRDVRLAVRIDEAVAEVGSGGRPGPG
ncbi:4a-hydroxytetrahydrobiopterin dehydratase [Amycolatopsis acidiphila]|uniref:Putative pterin-4-alpha-carbinolamine dehydratase n=1 Tax=Amycolatopsis acidiphila TaxID=715473 RepID=A0A558ADM9_9PSEU|nr:4a-hydroxytetrahydrobiopterin dehydratase [Amycolatopsis acidiphila]TVT22370.1 DUF2267 domain-containing protein [Amycolatopsis acidiphila]UIJ57566.1 4a-hydroxytetrahydrobiopterin dehydratase [Amycolatopsis acidiphila]GHG89529.1 hypothetical protein GCM10017788_64340 [Amycolatopsis acidiphila]